MDGKGKEPKDGMFMYGVVFTAVSKNKTSTAVFAPWGWGGIADTVIDAAAGKFGKGCPPKSDRFPGAK